MSQVAEGPPPMVTINAPASRVFASLANGDSIPNWMGRGSTARVSRRGPLVPGDTIALQTQNRFAGNRDRMRWIVGEVVPNKLLVLNIVDDSTGKVMGTRRDSLVAVGDSTRIISNIAVVDLATMAGPSVDSADKSAAAMLKVGERMMFSAFRMESKVELGRLKARIEGHK
jgi:uncharacterized protein YndB with AHSA1/START domain